MSKIRASAKGKECQVRIDGVCNFNPETVILAHLNGGGMGYKHNDLEASFCCSSCHDVLDGRVLDNRFSCDALKLMHHEGCTRTRKILLDKGLIKI